MDGTWVLNGLWGTPLNLDLAPRMDLEILEATCHNSGNSVHPEPCDLGAGKDLFGNILQVPLEGFAPGVQRNQNSASTSRWQTANHQHPKIHQILGFAKDKQSNNTPWLISAKPSLFFPHRKQFFLTAPSYCKRFRRAFRGSKSLRDTERDRLEVAFGCWYVIKYLGKPRA